MFELSPDETAANAYGVLDVRLTQAVAVHAHARHATTGKVRGEARESLGILVNTATE